MSLARNAAVQSTLTLGSRILGFARDLALAARFGQGPMMDAWATALMLPNLFRRLFAEGAFAQAFVPIYGSSKARDGEAASALAASEVMNFMFAVVAAFCILLQIFAPWYMPWLLSAWRDDHQVMHVAVTATRLAIPYLACMTIASLLSGVLNTSGRFALSAGAPVLLNLCTLVPLLAPSLFPMSQPMILLASSLAVTISGGLQAGLLWWGVRRLGVRLRMAAPRFTLNVKRTLTLAIPGALAGGAMQINSLVSQILTGSDEGARSVLYNADRLYQLPLGLVGVAIGLALVPRLTRAFIAEDHAEGARTLEDGVTLASAFALPAATALFVIPFFIIDATATRGAFTSADAARTADVLRQFAWGVPAFVLVKVLTPPFFARQDTRRPMAFAVASVLFTLLLGTGLFFGLAAYGIDGVIGLAVATSLSAWLNVALLAGTLVWENTWRPSAQFLSRFTRVLLSSGVLGGFLVAAGLSYLALSQLLITKEIAVLAVCAVGAALYAASLLLTRAVTLKEFRAVLASSSRPTPKV